MRDVLEPVRSRYAVRLALGFLAVIVVIIVVGTAISTQVSGQIQKNAEQNLQSVSSARAQHLDLWIRVTKQRTTETSAQSFFQTGDTDYIGTRLRQLQETSSIEGVLGLHYVDLAEERIVRSTNESLDGTKTDAPFVTEPEFRVGGMVHVTRPYESPLADHKVVAMVSPTSKEDRALVFVIDPQGQAVRNDTSERSTIIVNSEGRIVTHPNPERIGENYSAVLAHPSVGNLTYGEQTFVRLESPQGEVLAGVVRMTRIDWYVVTQTPVSEAYGLSQFVNRYLGGLVLLSVLGLGAIGLTVGRRTAVSIRELATRAEQLSDGQFEVTIESSRSDELGELYESLAEMRDSLQSRIREAQQAREEAESETQAAEEARQTAEREKQRTENLLEDLETTAGQYNQVMNATADGDLTRRMEPDSESDSMNDIARTFNGMAEDLRETVQEVSEFADTVAGMSREASAGAEEIREASEDVSDSVQGIYEDATEQAAKCDRIASEMNDLSATIEEIASTAEEVATLVERAAERGESGRDHANDAIDAIDAIETQASQASAEIRQLDEQVAQIDEIVGLIDGIAERTNTLALNASIEAARAGEAGEGFAVVAEEVKSLAEETQEATDEVADLIDGVKDQTGRSVEHIEEMDDRVTEGITTVEEALSELDAIVESVEDATDGVREITDATDDQATSTQQVVAMIEDLSERGDANADRAEEVATAAQQQSDAVSSVAQSVADLSEQAGTLQEQLAQFDVGTDGTETARPESEPVPQD